MAKWRIVSRFSTGPRYVVVGLYDKEQAEKLAERLREENHRPYEVCTQEEADRVKIERMLLGG